MTHTINPGTPSLQPVPLPLPGVGNKSFMTTWVLALLLGGLGIDRFYLGKVGTGILKLVTLGGFGIWALVDLIITLAGKQRDKQGFLLAGYAKHKVLAWIVTAVLIVVGAVSGGAAGSGSGTTLPAAAPAVSPAAAPLAAAPAPAAPAPAAKPAAPAPAKAPAPAAKTWTTVATLSGTAGASSQVFELTGAEAQLSYDFKGGADSVIAAVYLEPEGKDITKDGGFPLVMLSKAESSVTALHKSAGKYYLDVTAANIDSWTVTVQEKR